MTTKTNTEDISFEILTITPELAAQILEVNSENQRHVTKSHMWHMAQVMEKGQWRLNGETIVFSSEGKLMDGQTRMHALIHSGTSQRFIVVRGIDPAAFPSINRGKVRSHGNIMEIAKIKNSTLSASIGNGVLNYRRARSVNAGKGGSLNSYVRPSSEDILSEYCKNAQQYEFAIHLAQSCKKIVAPSISGTVAALAIIEKKHTEEEVRFFWDKVNTGTELTKNDPILLLRNRLLENNNTKAKLGQSLLTMLSIKAWNAFVSSKSLGVLRVMEGEICPEIL